MTLVPAALAIFGQALLWRARLARPPPRAGRERKGATEKSGAPRHLLGAAIRVPVLTAILCVAVLLAAASGLRHLELGNPVMRGLPETSEPRQENMTLPRQASAPESSGRPWLISKSRALQARSQLASFQARLGRERGVVGVLDRPTNRSLTAGVMLAPNGGRRATSWFSMRSLRRRCNQRSLTGRPTCRPSRGRDSRARRPESPRHHDRLRMTDETALPSSA